MAFLSFGSPICNARVEARRPFVNSDRGFSLVELIVVILLMGIMTVAIAPRLQRTQIDELGFFQGALAAKRGVHIQALKVLRILRVQPSDEFIGTIDRAHGDFFKGLFDIMCHDVFLAAMLALRPRNSSMAVAVYDCLA